MILLPEAENNLIRELLKSNIVYILVSYCCSTNLPQTWLKITKIYSYSSYRRSEVQNRSHGAKIKVLAKLYPSGRSRGELFPCLLQLLERGCLCSLGSWPCITPAFASIITAPFLTLLLPSFP